jgi:hypothetical protein
VVLVQTLEEHVEHGNVPDSPVTLPGSVTLATVLPDPGNIFPPVSGKTVQKGQ